MQQFKTRSALLRHLEGKLTDCDVAVAEGGMNLPRSALVVLAQKRTYDGSRRCSGFAAVAKAVQQHRLLGQAAAAADARSLHLSAANTAHALVHYLPVTQASSATASHHCIQSLADGMEALEQHV
jgi:hypothetical protein